MHCDFENLARTSPLIFGFIPIQSYLVLVGNHNSTKKLASLTRINELLRLFLIQLPSRHANCQVPIDSDSLEIIAHISSLLMLLQKLLDSEPAKLSNECFSILKMLITQLPQHILCNTEDFILASTYHRLDLENVYMRINVHLITPLLCTRLSTHRVSDFILIQMQCQNSNIRRNTIDTLSVIILSTKVSLQVLKNVCVKLIPALFDDEAKVRIAAMEFYAAVCSMNYMPDDHLLDYLSNCTPKNFHILAKQEVFLCLAKRIHKHKAPWIGPDGLLNYQIEAYTDHCNEACLKLRNISDNVSIIDAEQCGKLSQRASPWRTAIRRSRQPTAGYADQFSALQELAKSHSSSRLSRLTCRRVASMETPAEGNSRISDPSTNSNPNSYTLIAEKRRLLESEAKSRTRSLFSDRSEGRPNSVKNQEEKLYGLRRCQSAFSLEDKDSEGRASFSQITESLMRIKFSASKRLDSLRSRISQLQNSGDSPIDRLSLNLVDSLEKTRAWANETQALVSAKSSVRAQAHQRSPELTRMSSGYASEDVNHAMSSKSSLKFEPEQNLLKNKGNMMPSIVDSLMPVSALGKQIRPRLRKLSRSHPQRSRTVHWANRASVGSTTDPKTLLEDLNSTQWEKQFAALQGLGSILETDNQLSGWSQDRIQQLCRGLVHTAASLRSQVSRTAIQSIRFTIGLLRPDQLELVIRTLFFGLIGRVGGDASTAFLRNEAGAAIEALVEGASEAPTAAVVVGCLNDACHSAPARSRPGRRCLVRCYAAALPRMLLTSHGVAGLKGTPLSRRHQECLDRMLPHLASFLRDGDCETRNTAMEILRNLLTIRNFEAHSKVILNDLEWNTVKEALNKLAKRKDDCTMKGLFATMRVRRRHTLVLQRSVAGRASSQPPDGRLAPPPPPPPPPTPPPPQICATPLRQHSLELEEAQSEILVTPVERLSWQDRLFRLLEVAAQLVNYDVAEELSTTELVCEIGPMLSDDNEKVAATALKLCLDARQLHFRHTGKSKPVKDKFCPGLLSLLCEREDTEGFTSTIALIYHQLESQQPCVSELSRRCVDETRRILGVEALVKPLLKAIDTTTSTDTTTRLLYELCDVTADLDSESPLIGRYLLPTVARLLRRHEGTMAPQECEAISVYAKCIANLAGKEAFLSTLEQEGLEEHLIQSFLATV